MKRVIFYALLFFGINNYAQSNVVKDTIYMDENLIQIQKELYLAKKKAAVFYAMTYETNDLIIFKILYKNFFGKLNQQEFSQIKFLLNREFEENQIKNENIIINYRDTLHDYHSRKKIHTKHKNKIHTINNGQDTIQVRHHPFNKKIFDSEVKKYHNKKNKCKKRYEKRNTKSFYVYKINKGYPLNLEKINWLKDSGIFKNRFFKVMYENNLLVINSKGEYFMKSGHLSNKNLSKLLNLDDWSQYFIDFQKSIKSNSKSGFGIIEEFNKPFNNHIPHCF